MKKTISFFILFVYVALLSLNAQEKSTMDTKGKLGITFSSFGDNDVIRFNELEGAASYNSYHFYNFGISYIRSLSKKIELETGLEYAKHTFVVSPNLPPETEVQNYKANFALISIPLTFRSNFAKYFFIHGGILLDIDNTLNSKIDSQTGIGTMLGLAIKYDFNFGVSVYVNPYFKIHSLLPFADGHYHQRVFENGFRFGLTYNLGKQ